LRWFLCVKLKVQVVYDAAECGNGLAILWYAAARYVCCMLFNQQCSDKWLIFDAMTC
jgi:hypothetical protein